MRISDWSSDVCSSDLKTSCTSEARNSFNYGGNNALCDWLCTGFDFLGALRRCYGSGERCPEKGSEPCSTEGRTAGYACFDRLFEDREDRKSTRLNSSH